MRNSSPLHRRIYFLGLGLTLAVALCCASCDGILNRQWVAAVNGEKIYLDEFEGLFLPRLAMMKKNVPLDATQIGRLKKEFIDELIDERIMLGRAEDLGMTLSDRELQEKIDEIGKDYRARTFSELFDGKDAYRIWREQLRKRLILEKLIRREVNAGIAVSDEEARAYFRTQPALPEDTVHVSQIVLPARDKAEAVLRRLKNGEDFATLARELSTGPEAVRGGDLGSFARGVLPEQFDRVLFSLRPGTFSEIVETPYGYHIFKVVERIQRKTPEFEAMKGKIKEQLKRDKEAAAYERWLAALRSRASVKINQNVLEKAGQAKQ